MLGDNLITLRKSKSMTQRDLAKALNLSHTAIGKYERNEAEPDIATLKKLSSIFNVSIDYLVSDENDGDSLFFSCDDYEKLTSYIEESKKILMRYK